MSNVDVARANLKVLIDEQRAIRRQAEQIAERLGVWRPQLDVDACLAAWAMRDGR